MRIPVRDLKLANYFKDNRIIAGEGGLDGFITEISILESYFDYARFQRENGLSLISGWSEFFETEEKRRSLLRHLKEIGVACAGIYKYEFPDGYPDDIIEEANALGLPILELDDHQTMEKIIKYLSENVYMKFYRKFIPRDEIQEIFYLCKDENKFGCIGSRLREISGNKIFIRHYDSEFSGGKMDIPGIIAAYDNWKMTGLPLGKIEIVDRFYKYELSLDGTDYYWIGFHEYDGVEVTKAFWMFVDQHEIDELNYRFYYLAYKALRTEFKKKEKEFLAENQISIETLMQGKSLKFYEGKARCIVFSYELEEGLFHQAYSLIHAVLEKFRQGHRKFLLGKMQDQMALILFMDATMEKLGPILSLMQEQLCEMLPVSELFVAAGQTVESESLRVSWEKARRTLFWVRRRKRKTVGFYEELGVLGYLDTDIAEQTIRELDEKYILPLQSSDEDKNMDLLNTMEQYALSRWNYTEASKKLFVVSNTVKYRVKYAEGILDIDLSDPMERMNLEMAFAINRYLETRN